MWAGLTVTFVIIRKMPGGPMDFIMAQMLAGSLGPGSGGGDSTSAEQSEQFQQLAQTYLNVNPDQPLHIQYIDWMGSVLTGDLGQSIYYQEPVAAIFAEAIPWTVLLMSIAVVLSFSQQVIVGGLMANFEGSRIDFGVTTFLTWFQSIPFFVWGILMLFIIGFQLQWLPDGGQVNPSATPGLNVEYVVGVIRHAILPVTALALASLGAGALSMRGNAIQILGKDYVRVARLRGLTTRRVSVFYIARNAILPMYTNLLLSIAYIFGGSLILEAIFSYYGMGWYMFRALQARDYPLMMGGFLLFIITTVIAMLIADLTYPSVDPRIKHGESDESF
jgi:peptide/nickel transport system permease protein